MFRRADDVVLQVVDDRAFLLDASGTEMIVLNPVGTMVWEVLDAPAAPDAIASGDGRQSGGLVPNGTITVGGCQARSGPAIGSAASLRSSRSGVRVR